MAAFLAAVLKAPTIPVLLGGVCVALGIILGVILGSAFDIDIGFAVLNLCLNAGTADPVGAEPVDIVCVAELPPSGLNRVPAAVVSAIFCNSS